jgi:hypothetical protein
MYKLTFYLDSTDWRIKKLKSTFQRSAVLQGILEDHISYDTYDGFEPSEQFTRLVNQKMRREEKKADKLKAALLYAGHIKWTILSPTDFYNLQQSVGEALLIQSYFNNPFIIRKVYEALKARGWPSFDQDETGVSSWRLEITEVATTGE